MPERAKSSCLASSSSDVLESSTAVLEDLEIGPNRRALDAVGRAYLKQR
jgi:hypothetical protein